MPAAIASKRGAAMSAAIPRSITGSSACSMASKAERAGLGPGS